MEELSVDIDFNRPKRMSSVIKVIGVGGGGGNAVNYMHEKGITGVDFVICNTDAQDLNNSPIINKVQLGKKGLGAGANPDVGEKMAKESIDGIREILKSNTEMVFVTAGMGGGTGTGAAPIIAESCKELGILTVAIVTTPSRSEGPNRANNAEEGIKKLKRYIDSMIIVSNDKLREIHGELDYVQTFAKANEVLCTATKGMVEVITRNFAINIDLNDARKVLSNSGIALTGSATTKGKNRAEDAIKKALEPPLLENIDIRGAKNVLLQMLNDTKNRLTYSEVNTISEYIQKEAENEVDIILGIGDDETLKGGEIKVTVIVTGFEDGMASDGEKKIHTPYEEGRVSVNLSKPERKRKKKVLTKKDTSGQLSMTFGATYSSMSKSINSKEYDYHIKMMKDSPAYERRECDIEIDTIQKTETSKVYKLGDKTNENN